jgi:spore coat protein U-like protein
MFKKLALAAAAVAALTSGANAQVVQQSGVFTVSATITPTCVVTAFAGQSGAINFGTQGGIAGFAVVNAPLTVECSQGTPYTISAAPSGATTIHPTSGAFQMAGVNTPANKLDFNVFIAGTRLSATNSGQAGAPTFAGNGPVGGVQALTVDAQIDPGQGAKVSDTYNGAFTLTLSY